MGVVGQFGQWVVDRPIGRGAVATVYLCHLAADPDRIAAVKVLDQEEYAPPGSARMERFARELRLLEQLEHPGIVGVLDAGMEPDPWIALEYVTGRPLDQVRTGPRPPVEVLELARQLGDALGHAHTKGVFHRDVKPANILVEPEGRVCLVDFGIALAVHESRITDPDKVAPATLSYAPPEWFVTNRLAPPAKGDAYSLGVVLWEQLTGERAFAQAGQRPTLTSMLRAKLQKPFLDPGPNVPDALREVVRGLTLSDLEARWTLERATACLGIIDAAAWAPREDWSPRPVPVPRPASPLIGRERLLTQAVDLLEAQGVRLLSFVGPPGVGKSRLATEIAARVGPANGGGVAYAELGDAVSQAQVLHVLGRSLGHPGLDADALIGVLKDSGVTLWVLDDCEPATVALAPELTNCLTAHPPLSIVTTSGKRLGASGERVLAVDPLAPEAARALFGERAGASPSLAAHPGAELLRIADGLPLAIEAAAAVWPDPDAGKQAIDESLAHRLTRLWKALDTPLQELLKRLSVFSGPFALEAAEHILAASMEPPGLGMSVLGGLQRLVEAGAVRHHRRDGAFRLLAPLRRYADKELQALRPRVRAALARRHALWHAESASRLLAGASDDLAQAVQWAASRGEHDLAADLAQVCCTYADRFGGVSPLLVAVDGAYSATTAGKEGLAGPLATLHLAASDPEPAVHLVASEDGPVRRMVRCRLAWAAGEWARAEAEAASAVEEATAAGPARVAEARVAAGVDRVAAACDPEEVRADLEAAIHAAGASGDPWWTYNARWLFAEVQGESYRPILAEADRHGWLGLQVAVAFSEGARAIVGGALPEGTAQMRQAYLRACDGGFRLRAQHAATYLLEAGLRRSDRVGAGRAAAAVQALGPPTPAAADALALWAFADGNEDAAAVSFATVEARLEGHPLGWREVLGRRAAVWWALEEAERAHDALAMAEAGPPVGASSLLMQRLRVLAPALRQG